MEGFHSFWSRPGMVKNYGELRYAGYELLTTLLSALKWREHNGPIRMITDSPGAAFFERIGLTGAWDEVSTALDGMPEGLDPFLFWAAGKLWALRTMPCPCVMLDTDLIVWDRVDVPPGLDVMAAHPEMLCPEVYPDPAGFRLKAGYSLPAEWDLSLDAANTAFLYLRDPGFRDLYVDAALSFMGGVEPTGLNTTTAMCFAEQRVLPMCAAARGQRLGYLLDGADQASVTHVWGFKHLMEESAELRDAFCVKCVRRVLRDFPAWTGFLEKNEDLSRYLRPAMEHF